MGFVAAALVVLLALGETVVALVAPLRAPRDEHWRQAERQVRAGFRPGDLIVAAPAWSDPIMRLHLGDLIPVATASRMDAARFSRVWEISQRGARAPETDGGRVAARERHGALTVRLVERKGADVSYDFLARWTDAQVSRVEGSAADGGIPCPWQADRFQCPGIDFNFVKRQTMEVDTRLRQALMVQPVQNAKVVIEFPAVVLGREIAVGTGLANVWMRKAARGAVELTVLIDNRPALRVTTDNDSGWLLSRVDTTDRAGRTAAVRFEVTSAAPAARHFALAAEARS